MRCPNCNCDVPEGSLFCPECGQKLEGVNGSQAENSGETYNDQQQDAEDVYGDQQQIFMEPHLEIMEILMGISLRIREASMEILLRIRILEVPMEISPRISAGPIRGSKMAGIHTGDSLSLRIMDRSEWQQGIILITACRVEEKTRIRSLS